MTYRITVDLAEHTNLRSGPALIAWAGEDGQLVAVTGVLNPDSPWDARPPEPNPDDFPWMRELVHQMVGEVLAEREGDHTSLFAAFISQPHAEDEPIRVGPPRREDYELDTTYQAAVRGWAAVHQPTGNGVESGATVRGRGGWGSARTAPSLPEAPQPAPSSTMPLAAPTRTSLPQAAPSRRATGPAHTEYLCGCGSGFRSLDGYKNHVKRSKQSVCRDNGMIAVPRTPAAARAIAEAMGRLAEVEGR